MKTYPDFDYLARIKYAFSLNTSKKTSNILEGDFRSIYRGRSMEFDELGEYTQGDNVRDIDWKASSKADTILVRRYTAERKHNILFVCDRGVKMLADTSGGEPKSRLAVLCLGTAAYLCDRAGADYSCLIASESGYELDLFRSGTNHLENIIMRYSAEIGQESGTSVLSLLEHAASDIKKRQIIVLITDIEGIRQMTQQLISEVNIKNDLLVMNIDDAYLTDKNSFDVSLRRYASTFIPDSRELEKLEKNIRQQILDKAKKLFDTYRVGFVTVSREEEIIDKTLALFRRDNLRK